MSALSRINNTIRIPTSVQGKFFRIWFEFLAPLHGLTKREMDVAAAFVKQRFELSKVISDEDLLDKVVMSDSTKAKVKAECNISDAFFHVIMGKLRKNKVIIGDKINSKLIPKDLGSEDTSFQLLLHFDLDGNSNI